MLHWALQITPGDGYVTNSTTVKSLQSTIPLHGYCLIWLEKCPIVGMPELYFHSC